MSANLAFKYTDCEECGSGIDKGDPIYFNDGSKICEACAEDIDIVCPKCGGKKKPDFDTCFTCYQGSQ